jgi:hypothetical protein
MLPMLAFEACCKVPQVAPQHKQPAEAKRWLTYQLHGLRKLFDVHKS